MGSVTVTVRHAGAFVAARERRLSNDAWRPASAGGRFLVALPLLASALAGDDDAGRAAAGAGGGGVSPMARYTSALAHGYEITAPEATTMKSGTANQSPNTWCQLKSR